MAQIRLSKDVAEIAQQLSDEYGLGSQRTAIEAVFRTHWQQWHGGKGKQSDLSMKGMTPHPLEPNSVNGAQALDALGI